MELANMTMQWFRALQQAFPLHADSSSHPLHTQQALWILQQQVIVAELCMLAVQAVLEQEARIAGFKSEVQKSQELHHSSLTRDTDRLQTMLDKVKAEIR